MLGLGLSTGLAPARPGGIAALAPLAWYDAGHGPALYQDAAGTTPASEAGQPVRRLSSRAGGAPALTIGATGAPASRTATGVGFAGAGVYLKASLAIPASHAIIVKARIDSWSAHHGDLFCCHGAKGTELRAGDPSAFRALVIGSDVAIDPMEAGGDWSGSHVFTLVLDAAGATARLRIDGTEVAADAGYDGSLTSPTEFKLFGSRWNSAYVSGELRHAVILGSADLGAVAAAEAALA
ncbi:hypothetical protein [Pseudoroseicyclus sp. CXY001]|uniref:hypothetical protein n=1 Tax=Pseudoroseicyclus sp. CXY001 TaxID=3242492 RepID=UPI0035715391